MKPSLLIFEQRMMGDAVMALPFLRAAKEKYEVYVACSTGSAEQVFQLVLPSDRILAWSPPWIAEQGKYDSRRWLKSGMPEFIRRTRAIRPDIAVSVWPDTRVHLLMALSGAPRRVGLPMVEANYYATHLAWRQRQLKIGKILEGIGNAFTPGGLLTDPAFRAKGDDHHVLSWRAVSEPLGLAWNPTAPWVNPDFGNPVPELAAEVATARAAGRPIWLIHPGARVPERRWPVKNFSQLIAEMLRPVNAFVVWVHSSEVEGDPFQMGADAVCEPRNIKELFAITQLADHVLCNDTGVAHVAAALGKRTVSVFTAGSTELFAPWGSADLVGRRQVCEFHPCLGRCLQPTFICLEAADVDMMRPAMRKVLAEGYSIRHPTIDP
jgi:ADP-heptose:LPS heptosyltransferase